MRVGVVSIQGDFDKHLQALDRCSAPGVEPVEVRTPEDLSTVDRVIIPGGESTTVGLLMDRFGLGAAIQARAAEGMPVWGTCMGMIMMSAAIQGRPEQYRLSLLDIEVRRNAFGAQVHSFEDAVDVKPLGRPVLGVFIRAPIVTRLGPEVEVIGEYGGKVVAVRQKNKLGTSFHPELTTDTGFHDWFVEM